LENADAKIVLTDIGIGDPGLLKKLKAKILIRELYYLVQF